MQLSKDEKIGQRFIFGVNNTNTDCIISLIKDCHIGGLILYKKNYNSYQEMLTIIKKFKEANKNNKIPLFIGIDEEGGRVNRMPSEIHNINNIYDVSMKDNNFVYDYANVIGKLLNQTGINMNFAPVMDSCELNGSKMLYKRCFYKDISMCGNMYVDALSNNKVIPVIKHYPGHGVTNFDSHFFVPYVFNYKSVLNNHMKHFDDVIDKGCDAVMLGHIVIRRLTKLLPASISEHFIKKYLRNKFDGLIITDEVNMLKRNPFYRFIYLDKCLKSSSDIVLIKINDFDEGYRIISKYKKMLINDKINKQLDDSVKRIIKVKNKYKINDDIGYNGCNVATINDEIDNINRKVVNN